MVVALGVVVLCGGAGLCQRWGEVSAQPPLCSVISLPSLQAKHTQEGSQTWGVNGESGALADMKELGVWEPLAVKLQTYKTAVEVRRADGRTDGQTDGWEFLGVSLHLVSRSGREASCGRGDVRRPHSDVRGAG